MTIELSLYETRVIGALMEKEVTTPDQYPMSLNALKNACNQKSNRHPVLDMDDADVSATLESLESKRLVRRITQGSRVEKFKHLFCNTEFGDLQFTPQQYAIVCELLLRGPQTPGELRSRGLRMAEISDVKESEAVLKSLVDMSGGPFVALLPKEPGKREAKYTHLFGGEIDQVVESSVDDVSVAGLQAQIGSLKDKVSLLEAENERLIKRLRALGEAE